MKHFFRLLDLKMYKSQINHILETSPKEYICLMDQLIYILL